jgi:hypothetical protein
MQIAASGRCAALVIRTPERPADQTRTYILMFSDLAAID